MRHSLRNILVAMLAMALFVGGCDSNKSSEPAQQPAASEEVQAPAADDAAEEAQEDVAAADVNEDNYIKASFELNCVADKIDDSNVINAAADTIYSRHGFTEETFTKAKDAIGEKESVELAVKTRMENCTEELAQGFAGVDADDAAKEDAPAVAEEAPAKAEPVARPAKVGTLRAQNIKGSNFEGAELRLNVAANFKVSGDFKGKREGRAFIVPITGEVDKNGTIKASGKRGNNSVDVGGRLSADGARGTVSGSIFENNYSVRYNAQ